MKKYYTLEEAIQHVEVMTEKEVISIIRVTDSSFNYCLINQDKQNNIEMVNLSFNHSPEY